MSTFQCRLDSGDYETCLSPVSYPLLAEGSHALSVKATDLSGNTDPSPATYTWTIDTTVPVTTVTPLGGFYNTEVTVTLTVNEPAAIYYTTDGSMPTTDSLAYSTPIGITSTTTLKYFAKDGAGNEEAMRTEEYIIVYTISGSVNFWKNGAGYARGAIKSSWRAIVQRTERFSRFLLLGERAGRNLRAHSL